MSEILNKIAKDGTLEADWHFQDLMSLHQGLFDFIDITVRIPFKGSKALIELRILTAYPPGTINDKKVFLSREEEEDYEKTADCFLRAETEMTLFLRSKMWCLIGITTDRLEKPVCILVLPNVISTYSFKRDHEKDLIKQYR